MKKVSAIIKEKSAYNLDTVINDIALASNNAGETGLINIRTGEVVGSFGDYDSRYDLYQKLFYQERTIEDESKDPEKSKTYIRIYDALNEKMIVNGWLIVERIVAGNCPVIILQDPSTGKYHLLNSSNSKSPGDILEDALDEVNDLNYDLGGDYYFRVSKGGKKALYSSFQGLITPYEYDDIQKIGMTMVFTKGKHKFFIVGNRINDKSPLFDEIKPDENDPKIIYCKKKSTITIYYADNSFYEALYNFSGYDDVKCLQKTDELYIDQKFEYNFLLKKKNKYGLCYGVRRHYQEADNSSCKLLLDIEYDAIEYKDGDFYLTKDGKLGLLTGTGEKRTFISPKFDKIIKLRNEPYYEVFNGDERSIINATDESVVISNYKIIENVNGGDPIIFEKDGKKGILYILLHGTSLLNGYDDIVHIVGHYYLVIKNGKMGLIFSGKTIVEPIYESIEINGYSYEQFKSAHNPFEDNNNISCLYLTLKNPSETYGIVKCRRSHFDTLRETELEILSGTGFKDIKLLEDIVVLKEFNKTYVYDYSNKLLKTFPEDVQISADTSMGHNFYLVDGEHYRYVNEEFQKAYFEDVELYATAYESEYGTVVVNSRDKAEHDRICAEIEKLDDQTFDDTLISLYGQNQISLYDQGSSVQEEHPTLTRKPNKLN